MRQISRKTAVLGVVAMLLGGLVAPATALDIDINTIDPTWVNPVARTPNATFDAYLDPNVAGPGGNTSVFWGQPFPNTSGPQSGYGLDPNAPQTVSILPVPGTQTFRLGDFTHFNHVIRVNNPDTALLSVDLSLAVDIDGVTADPTYTFRFTHDETLNFPAGFPGTCAFGSTAAGCNDRVRISTLDEDPVIFEVGDFIVSMTLLGFGATPEAAVLNGLTFITNENADNTTSLWAIFEVANRPIEAPAPAGLILMGLGLVGVAVASRFRK